MTDIWKNLANHDARYHNFESYLDLRSNGILFDDICLHMEFDILKDNSKADEEKYEAILHMILYEIIWRIMQKGGKPRDTGNMIQSLIESYGANYVNRKLAMELASFQVNNPDYGEDWSGIWFESTDASIHLRKELDEKYPDELKAEEINK